MPRKKKADQPIGVGLTSKQMKRKKPINTDMMRDIEPLTDNQKKLFDCLEGFTIIWSVKVRAFLTNMLQLLLVVLEKATRGIRLKGIDTGMRTSRTASRTARIYVKTVRPLVEKITKKDYLKFDSSGVIMLLERK